MPERTHIAAALALVLVSLAACSIEPPVSPQPGVPVAPSEAPAEPTGAPEPPVVPPTLPTPVGPPVAEPSGEPEPPSAPTPAPLVALHSPGDTGDGIRELQHRLLQLKWLAGDITDGYDERTRAAVDGFQAKRGLPVLGYVDGHTWDRLLDMTRTPTHEEKHNILQAGPPLLARGDSGEAVRDLQARMKQIGWFDHQVTGNYGPVTVEAIRGFQSKRSLPVTGAVDQATLDALHNMTRKPTAEELADPAKPSGDVSSWDSRCLTGRVLCVSKQERQLAWIVGGEVQFTADVRFGSELTPTREGSFAVNWKSRDHVSSLYDTSMPYAMFFSGGQAIHYSPDFAANGYNGASHGCVNLRDRGVAERLFDRVRTGDQVIVY